MDWNTWDTDRLRQCMKFRGLDDSGTREELINRIENQLESEFSGYVGKKNKSGESLLIGRMPKGKLRSGYETFMTLRTIIISPITPELMAEQTLVSWMEECKSFSVKKLGSGISVCKLVFPTMNTGDAAYLDLKKNFNNEGVTVTHLKVVPLAQSKVSGVKHDYDILEDGSKDKDFWQRLIILENLPAKINTEESLTELFPEAENAFSFEHDETTRGIAVLEFTTSEELKAFMMQNIKNKSIKLPDGTAISAKKYVLKGEKGQLFHLPPDRKDMYSEAIKPLSKDERLRSNKKLNQLHEELENVFNEEDIFGKEKLLRKLALEKMIDYLELSLKYDTKRRINSKQLEFPEPVDTMQPFVKKALGMDEQSQSSEDKGFSEPFSELTPENETSEMEEPITDNPVEYLEELDDHQLTIEKEITSLNSMIGTIDESKLITNKIPQKPKKEQVIPTALKGPITKLKKRNETMKVAVSALKKEIQELGCIQLEIEDRERRRKKEARKTEEENKKLQSIPTLMSVPVMKPVPRPNDDMSEEPMEVDNSINQVDDSNPAHIAVIDYNHMKVTPEKDSISSFSKPRPLPPHLILQRETTSNIHNIRSGPGKRANVEKQPAGRLQASENTSNKRNMRSGPGKRSNEPVSGRKQPAARVSTSDDRYSTDYTNVKGDKLRKGRELGREFGAKGREFGAGSWKPTQPPHMSMPDSGKMEKETTASTTDDFNYKKLYITGFEHTPNRKEELESLFAGAYEVRVVKLRKSTFALAFYNFESECKEDHDDLQGMCLDGVPLNITYSTKSKQEKEQEQQKKLEAEGCIIVSEDPPNQQKKMTSKSYEYSSDDEDSSRKEFIPVKEHKLCKTLYIRGFKKTGPKYEQLKSLCQRAKEIVLNESSWKGKTYGFAFAHYEKEEDCILDHIYLQGAKLDGITLITHYDYSHYNSISEEDKKDACFKCGKKGHAKRNCPSLSQGKCYRCGVDGHTTKDCPVPSKDKCYKCHQVGHMSKDCKNTHVECYKCYQVGHVSRDCKNTDMDKNARRRNQTNRKQELDKRRSKDEDEHAPPSKRLKKEKCFKCGEKGHRARDCSALIGERCLRCGERGHFAKDNQCVETCFRCGEKGHIATDTRCPVYAEGDKDKCYKCGKKGHRSKDCDEISEQKCYKCGVKGHRSKECTAESCYKCGEKGHLVKDCTMITAERCFRCGERGHFAKDNVCEKTCFRCNGKGHYATDIECPRYEDDIDTCKKCGGVGHRERDCTSRSRFYGTDTPALNALANQTRKSGKGKFETETEHSSKKRKACILCGEKGHSSLYCTNAESKEKNRACMICGEKGHSSLKCTNSGSKGPNLAHQQTSEQLRLEQAFKLLDENRKKQEEEMTMQLMQQLASYKAASYKAAEVDSNIFNRESARMLASSSTAGNRGDQFVLPRAGYNQSERPGWGQSTISPQNLMSNQAMNLNPAAIVGQQGLGMLEGLQGELELGALQAAAANPKKTVEVFKDISAVLSQKIRQLQSIGTEETGHQPVVDYTESRHQYGDSRHVVYERRPRYSGPNSISHVKEDQRRGYSNPKKELYDPFEVDRSPSPDYRIGRRQEGSKRRSGRR